MQINQETRLGRMLDAGRLTATVTSKRTGQHLTVTLKALDKPEGGKWQQVEFNEARFVSADEGKGGYGSLRIGRVNPKSGELRAERGVSAGFVYAVNAVLAAARTGEQETEQAYVNEMNLCGRCGRELTDPESIARGIGPECMKKQTKSKSARAAQVEEGERRMQEMEAAGDRAGTIRDEIAKHDHKRRVETQPEPHESECYNCGGSGVFKGGGIVENGVYKGYQGTCYRCGGKGVIDSADEKRNWGYDNFYRRAYA